jgi:hypothetical protein
MSTSNKRTYDPFSGFATDAITVGLVQAGSPVRTVDLTLTRIGSPQRGSVSVAWGDGNTDVLAFGVNTASHQYGTTGAKTVTVTYDDARPAVADVVGTGNITVT